VLDVPHQAGVNFGVIGNVLSAKAKGVIVTRMLLGTRRRGNGACSLYQREQKNGGCAFQNDLHFTHSLRSVNSQVPRNLSRVALACKPRRCQARSFQRLQVAGKLVDRIKSIESQFDNFADSLNIFGAPKEAKRSVKSDRNVVPTVGPYRRN
jgi:hypothetical protein